MALTFSRSWEYDHGERCGCLVLAAAMGAGVEISCYYCKNVLQKHWQIECAHGSHAPTANTKAPIERWQNVGKIDAVKAVLVKEA